MASITNYPHPPRFHGQDQDNAEDGDHCVLATTHVYEEKKRKTVIIHPSIITSKTENEVLITTEEYLILCILIVKLRIIVSGKGISLIK